MTKDQALREISRLRSEARLAYLDGRENRAKELNRKADLLGSPWRAEELLTHGDFTALDAAIDELRKPL